MEPYLHSPICLYGMQKQLAFFHLYLHLLVYAFTCGLLPFLAGD
jgi:hypothetical protein